MSRLDPDSRLKVWDLLTTHRTGRTILLITHCMDEAEYLGGRIAVMANGKLQCYGTARFLKQVVGREDTKFLVELFVLLVSSLNKSANNIHTYILCTHVIFSVDD